MKHISYTRFSIISPLFEHENRTQFLRLMQIQGHSGCVSAVKSFEDYSFDQNGKLALMKTEWEKPESVVLAEINCTASKDSHSLLNFQKEKFSSTLLRYNLAQSAAVRSIDEYLKLFHSDAIVESDGKDFLIIIKLNFSFFSFFSFFLRNIFVFCLSYFNIIFGFIYSGNHSQFNS